MKRPIKIMLGITLAMIVILGVMLALNGNILQGRLSIRLPAYDQTKVQKSVRKVKIPPAYNDASCKESDNGKDFSNKGNIDGKLAGGQTHKDTDFCIPSSFGDDNPELVGKLREYYCDEDGYVKYEDYSCPTSTHCYQGACQSDSALALKGLYVGCTNPWVSNYDSSANAENDSCLYLGNKHIPLTRPFPINDEEEIPPAYIHQGSILVIVPSGYEEYGEAMLQDLQYCQNLVTNFLGINSYWEDIIAKIYVSKDGQTSGEYNPEIGNIIYKKSQENLNDELQEVITNNEEGFLYNSSPSYCANTHEYTHFIVAKTHIPWWANEGIAEYSQKYNQLGSKDEYVCDNDGWYGNDYWGDGQYKKFEYSNLLEEYGNNLGDGPKWYHTAMCFWELFEQSFGHEKLIEAFQLLRLKDSEAVQLNEPITKFFIEEILFEVVDNQDLKTILDKFGFTKGVDYTF